MFRFAPRFTAVLLLVVAGAVAPAAAKERPFHAAGEGVVAGSLYAPECKATHLGHSTLYVDAISYFLADYGLFVPGIGRITSASGDQLDFDFDADDYTVDQLTPVVSATVTFTGGTGRFQDASGSAVVMLDFSDYLFNFTYGFSFLIEGSIDY